MSSGGKKKKSSVTKSELVEDISEKLNMSKKDVNVFLDTLSSLIEEYLMDENSITLPNLVKFSPHIKPATKAKVMKNPFSGEMMKVSAKPAKKVVKAKIVKSLKELYLN